MTFTKRNLRDRKIEANGLVRKSACISISHSGFGRFIRTLISEHRQAKRMVHPPNGCIPIDTGVLYPATASRILHEASGLNEYGGRPTVAYLNTLSETEGFDYRRAAPLISIHAGNCKPRYEFLILSRHAVLVRFRTWSRIDATELINSDIGTAPPVAPARCHSPPPDTPADARH